MSSTRSILLRGFSPAYDNTMINKQRVLWYIYKDANNYSQLYLDNATKTFNYQKCVGGVLTTLTSNAETFLKYQVFNILCQQTSTGMKMSILKNTGTYETYSNTNTTYFEGNCSLYPLTKNVTGSEADAFMDSFVYIPSVNYDDISSEAILRGTQAGFTFNELFDINAVSLHTNATRSNGVITLNATSAYQTNTVKIPILPNSQYELTMNTNGDWDVCTYYNSIKLKNLTSTRHNTSTVSITTSNNCNYILLSMWSTSAGIFTFSNISLKIKM